MKGILLQTLKYPQAYIRQQIDLEGCPHGSHFNKHDPQCLDCYTRFECEWLNNNDECSTCSQSVGSLLQALEFSLEYIDGRIADVGHNISECQCDNCQWLRWADQVYLTSYRAKAV